MDKKYPNFLIVGAAKAATTTIHEYLKQHPDIFMTERKEPCFFLYPERITPQFSTHPNNYNNLFVNSFEEYLKLFDNSSDAKILGESSTPYLYLYHQVIPNIKKYIPNYEGIKILIVLRNPTDRAYSQYMMKRRDLKEDLTFEDALTTEPDRIKQNFHFDFFYKDRGLYYEQVKAYLDNFSNVKIMLYEDFKMNKTGFLDEITDFLNIKKHVYRDIPRQNVSGLPRFKFITRAINEDSFLKNLAVRLIPKSIGKFIITKIQSRNIQKSDAMNHETKVELNSYYKPDIKKLESLINRDLTHWYN